MSENTKRLTRTREGKMLAGVCSGVAKYFDIDATIVRIVMVALTFLTGLVPGIALYIAAALIVPEEGKDASIAQDLINKQTTKGDVS